jgi:hypothetical protein
MYGCKTWSLILKKEHRLRVFDNRALRRIFGRKREEVAGRWRRLHSEELHNLYTTKEVIIVIKSRRMDVGHVARIGATRNVHNILVGKPETKRPLGRSRCRWEDNIRMDLRE